MSEQIEFSPVETVKRLVRTAQTAALGTLDQETGHPFVSLVTTATAHDGSPLLLLSDLARHTANIKHSSAVSLLCDECAPGDRLGDPLMMARVTVTGQVAVSDDPIDRARFLAAQPEAEAYAHFTDFSLYRLTPDTAHLVAGFGQIVSLSAEEFLTECSDCDALIAAEAEAVEHMNTDHVDALQLYAEIIGRRTDKADWHITGLDPEGFDLTNGGDRLRIPFPYRITGPSPLRSVLKVMADQARRAAG